MRTHAMANADHATSQPEPELAPVRPPTLPPDFPDTPQNPSSRLQPPPNPPARAGKVAGTLSSPVSSGSGSGRTSFSIEIKPREDPTTGATVPAVIVTIDGHETVVTFQSEEDAEAFAQIEHARLRAEAKKA
jgi:hypothetical protein